MRNIFKKLAKALSDGSETKNKRPRTEKEWKIFHENQAEKRGLKKFDFPNGSVYALNEKNAIRKAQKLKLY